MDRNTVYLDYAAATPVDPAVIDLMRHYLQEEYGNAGSLHRFGTTAKQALGGARRTFADLLSCNPQELIFTGSGTESNNIAVQGLVRALFRAGEQLADMHFITSSVEHPSILDIFKEYECLGASVTYLPVDQWGLVSASAVKEAIQANTVLVSVMYVNNEMGAIEPIEEIGQVIQKNKQKNGYPYFHTDASQAALVLPLALRELGVDLLTIDGQKIYGPKGIGLLYKKEGTPLAPVILGGNQEFGLRPGTENIPSIVGFAKAYELVREDQEAEVERLKELRDHCIASIRSRFPQAVVNGPIDDMLDRRMANNVNVSFPEIEGEYLVIALSDRGYACGTRSACITGGGPSYVVSAMGRRELANNSLRISLGRPTTKDDIDGLLDAIGEIAGNFDTYKN